MILLVLRSIAPSCVVRGGRTFFLSSDDGTRHVWWPWIHSECCWNRLVTRVHACVFTRMYACNSIVYLGCVMASSDGTHTSCAACSGFTASVAEIDYYAVTRMYVRVFIGAWCVMWWWWRWCGSLPPLTWSAIHLLYTSCSSAVMCHPVTSVG